MGYSDLTAETMTAISGAWLDPARERPLLMRLPRVAPLVVNVEAAHQGIVRYQEPRPKVSPEVAALTQRTMELDARHDRLARGLYDVLDGLSTLAENADDAQGWQDLQRELFPQGKRIVFRSYVDQAGEAERVDERLSEASRRRLEKFTLGGVPLMHYVREWQAAAKELGEVEQRRLVLAKEPPERPTLREVRNAWIAAVKAVVAMLEWETELSEAERGRILEPLETALARAEAKKRAKTVVEAKGEAEEAKAEAG